MTRRRTTIRLPPRSNRPRRRTKLPPEFDDADGFYAAARRYGEAVDVVQAWHPRRYELIGELRARGFSMPDIADLLRVSTHVAYVHLNEWKRLIAEYDRRMSEGDDVVVS